MKRRKLKGKGLLETDRLEGGDQQKSNSSDGGMMAALDKQ